MKQLTQAEIQQILEQYNLTSRLLQADDYQAAAGRTGAPNEPAIDFLIWPNTCNDLPSVFDPRAAFLLHAILGVAKEGGELADALVRATYYGQKNKALNVDNVVEECGDVLWYIALALRAVDRTMSECMRGNIAKLAARYGEKFTEEAAANRSVEKEMVALKSSMVGELQRLDAVRPVDSLDVDKE